MSSDAPMSPVSASSANGSTYSFHVNTDYTSAQRFPIWMALSVFSAICLASLQSRRSIQDIDTAGEKWVMAVTIISMVLSFVAVVFYLIARAVFVAQIPEVAMTSLLIAFWAAGLPTIMNPGNGIAVVKPSNEEIAPTVLNANLYFFSWLAFAATIYLSASLLQESMNVDVRGSTPAKMARWYGLCTTSMIVMGSAVRIFTTSDCDAPSDREIEYCKRTKFAVSVGVIGFFLALFMTYFTHKGNLTKTAEMGITVFQLIIWCFGCGYITFGEGPGTTIGNLFFSAWISFLLTVFIFGTNFREYVSSRDAAGSDSGDHRQEEAAPVEEHQEYDDNI